MSDLKNSWKNTGSGLGHAFRDLGKTLINSGKKGVDKAVDWAGKDQPQPPAQVAQQPVQVVQQPAQVVQQPAAQPPQNMSVADEISKLAVLRDQGFLTEEEFTAKKRQLLGID